MKGKIVKKAAMLSFALTILVSPGVYAEELEEFTLDPVSVTATRIEKRDLEIPATVRVYSGEELEATGAKSVLEALSYSEGIVYDSQGPAGQSMSTMTSKVIIRGMERGTAVLINGVPINLRSAFSLEDLPIGAVERVEVMRGNGAVLYGSEASGGAINIITKGSFDRQITIAGGDMNKKKYGLDFQEGKLGISYSHSRLGEVKDYGNTTDYISSLKKSRKDSGLITYKFDDNWSITHLNSRNRYSRWRDRKSTGALYNTNDYVSRQSKTFITYQDDTVRVNLYNNQRKIRNVTTRGANVSSSVNADYTRGVDFQKRFDLSKGNILFGFDVHKENYENSAKAEPFDNIYRMNYSIFAQWNAVFNDRWEMNLGARGTWTGSTPGGNNYNNLSPQIQFLYKANKNTSFYSNVGKSFLMPSFTQLFGSGSIIGNAELKPATGWQYEIGAKHIRGKHSWRLALFYLEVNDYISSTGVHPNLRYTNSDVRNLGVELAYDVQLNKALKLTTGVTVARPQEKVGNSTWYAYQGRLQYNLGINYSKDKWSASLMGNYLGKRTAQDATRIRHHKALLLTTAKISYKPDKNNEIYFTMENLFDRDATTLNSLTSIYHQTPRNFEIGYKFKF